MIIALDVVGACSMDESFSTPSDKGQMVEVISTDGIVSVLYDPKDTLFEESIEVHDESEESQRLTFTFKSFVEVKERSAGHLL